VLKRCATQKQHPPKVKIPTQVAEIWAVLGMVFLGATWMGTRRFRAREKQIPRAFSPLRGCERLGMTN
jgi:hypothetical protein